MAEVDIIELWNKGKRHSSGGEELNIDELVTKKSKTPLYWIKIILWIEFWLNLICLPLIFIFFKEDEPLLYGFIMPIIIIIYLFYYQFLIQKVKAFDYTIDVKTGLKKLLGYLNFFFLHYKVVIWVFIPLGYAYGVYTALQENPEGGTTSSLLITIGVGIVVCGILGLVFNFLINLIYGRKIRRLRKIFVELDQTASEEQE